jgi:hypothetical protein
MLLPSGKDHWPFSATLADRLPKSARNAAIKSIEAISFDSWARCRKADRVALQRFMLSRSAHAAEKQNPNLI